VYRRGEQKTIDRVLERAQRKIRSLEEMSTRQSLPIGYEWTVVGPSLYIRRKSDGLLTVIVPRQLRRRLLLLRRTLNLLSLDL